MADNVQSKDNEIPEGLRIVGKVAHDLNNLLTPLMAYPQLIKSELPDDSSAVELLDAIEDTARDISHISRQLQVLSMPICCDVNDVDINEVVGISVQEIRKDIHGNDAVQIQVELTDDLPPVRGNGEYLEKVIEDLGRNGIEAMGDGDASHARGRLTVRTESRSESGRRLASGADLPAGDYECVVIDDEGTGIDSSVMDTILEPFVTTRKTSSRRGAGLGLSVVAKIMSEHAGFIDFENKVEKGARFVLMFPRKNQDSNSNPVEDEESQSMKAGGKVLVVDDEESILRLFKMMISSRIPGCEVDVAENGAVAVEKFTAGRHNVIIMDLHMPVLDGQAAFLQIKKLCEEQGWDMPRVIFCTGFVASETLRATIDSEPRHCLFSKPVSIDLLLDAISERLCVSTN